MKKITIPEDMAKIPTTKGDMDYPFANWVDDIINATDEFGKGVKMLRRVNELFKIVDDAAKSDEAFLLEEEHYKLLKKAMATPLKVIFGRRAEASGYYDAVENAEDFTPQIPE